MPEDPNVTPGEPPMGFVERLHHTQINPQRIADDLRERGIEVELAQVNIVRDEGFLVECAGCGRTGRLPFDPGTKIGLCPNCVAEGKLLPLPADGDV